MNQHFDFEFDIFQNSVQLIRMYRSIFKYVYVWRNGSSKIKSASSTRTSCDWKTLDMDEDESHEENSVGDLIYERGNLY